MGQKRESGSLGHTAALQGDGFSLACWLCEGTCWGRYLAGIFSEPQFHVTARVV